MAGVLVLGFAAILLLAWLWAGRWAAGLPFGARRLGDALKPSTDRDHSDSLPLVRAAGGILGWYAGAGLLVAAGLVSNGEMRIDDASMRVQVAAGGPADRAGIKRGDRIVAVDTIPVESWDTLKTAIAKKGVGPVVIDVDRAGTRLTFEPVAEGTPAKILVGPFAERESVGLGRALVVGLSTPAKVMWRTAGAFIAMFAGSESAELSGPVAVVQATNRAHEQGTGVAFQLAGMIGAYFLPVIALASFIAAFSRRPRHAPSQS